MSDRTMAAAMSVVCWLNKESSPEVPLKRGTYHHYDDEIRAKIDKYGVYIDR